MVLFGLFALFLAVIFLGGFMLDREARHYDDWIEDDYPKWEGG